MLTFFLIVQGWNLYLPWAVLLLLSLNFAQCLIIFFFLQVNMFTNQGTVIHFNNPKVQASLAANTFTITGHAENKQLTEMLPGILNQLGADSLTSLRRLAESLPKPGTSKQRKILVCISSFVCCIADKIQFPPGGESHVPTIAAEEEEDEVPGKHIYT